jgi:hypothetical protein
MWQKLMQIHAPAATWIVRWPAGWVFFPLIVGVGVWSFDARSSGSRIARKRV